jgi:ABC-type transport system substrate-binding protein
MAVDQNEAPGFDPEAARRELAEYRNETGVQELTVEMLGTADSISTSVLQLVQAQWKELGITATVRTFDQVAVAQGLILGATNIALIPSWSAPDPDENRYFWAANSSGVLSLNFSGFANAETERLLALTATTADLTARKDIYSQLVRELNRNVTNIWLYATPYSLVADRSVQGLQAARDVPFGTYEPKTWWGQLWLAR